MIPMSKEEESLRSAVKSLQEKQKIFWTVEHSEMIKQLWREIEAVSREKTVE